MRPQIIGAFTNFVSVLQFCLFVVVVVVCSFTH